MKINKSIFKIIALALFQVFMAVNCVWGGSAFWNSGCGKQASVLSPEIHIDVRSLQESFYSDVGNDGIPLSEIVFNALDANKLSNIGFGRVVKVSKDDDAQAALRSRPQFVSHQLARFHVAVSRCIVNNRQLNEKVLKSIIKESIRVIKKKSLLPEEVLEKMANELDKNSTEKEVIKALLSELNYKIEDEGDIKGERIIVRKAIENVYQIWSAKWVKALKENNVDAEFIAETLMMVTRFTGDEIDKKIKEGIRPGEYLYQQYEKGVTIAGSIKDSKRREALQDSAMICMQILNVYEQEFIKTVRELHKRKSFSYENLWKEGISNDMDILLKAIAELEGDLEKSSPALRFLEMLKERLNIYLRDFKKSHNTVLGCLQDAQRDFFEKEKVKKPDVREISGIVNNLVDKIRDIAHFEKAKGDPVIIVTQAYNVQLMVRDMMLYNVCGIVSKQGRNTSHWLITAGAEGIPAVTAASDEDGRRPYDFCVDGEMMVVDAREKKVVSRPDKKTILKYGRKQQERNDEESYYEQLYQEPAITNDGIMVKIKGNVDTIFELEEMKMRFPDTEIGLLRAELLLAGKSLTPSTINSLVDSIAIVSGEISGLRYDRRADKTGEQKGGSGGFQYLRADSEGKKVASWLIESVIQQAVLGRKAALMWPLISSYTDVNYIVNLEKELIAQSQQKGLSWKDENLKFGSMIETVSAVMNIDYLLEHFDFFSVGTNDLMWELSNISRDADLSQMDSGEREQIFNEAYLEVLKVAAKVFSAVKQTNAGLEAKKEICVCGEMAHDELFILFSVGAVDENLSVDLSMSIERIGRTKEFIRHLDAAKCREVFKDLNTVSFDELKKRAQEYIDEVNADIEQDRQNYSEAKRRQKTDDKTSEKNNDFSIIEGNHGAEESKQRFIESAI